MMSTTQLQQHSSMKHVSEAATCHEISDSQRCSRTNIKKRKNGRSYIWHCRQQCATGFGMCSMHQAQHAAKVSKYRVSKKPKVVVMEDGFSCVGCSTLGSEIGVYTKFTCPSSCRAPVPERIVCGECMDMVKSQYIRCKGCGLAVCEGRQEVSVSSSQIDDGEQLIQDNDIAEDQYFIQEITGVGYNKYENEIGGSTYWYRVRDLNNTEFWTSEQDLEQSASNILLAYVTNRSNESFNTEEANMGVKYYVARKPKVNAEGMYKHRFREISKARFYSLAQ